jgi:hypothetical protein
MKTLMKEWPQAEEEIKLPLFLRTLKRFFQMMEYLTTKVHTYMTSDPVKLLDLE